ncbi:MAG: T9SS type A sorting domain-containing protein [Candidatus Latescibacteria bacterium]|nr:T9SS type A sorting domain-containing protein [Candidatus Latescibacterota bacterium]
MYRARVVLMMALSGLIAWYGPLAVSASAQTLVADYQFENTRSSSVGTPPALTDLGSGSNAFIVDTIDGQTRTVLAFPEGNGLALSPTTGVILNETYSIVILFRFSTVSDYRRLVEFKNATADEGLYNLDGDLVFYDEAYGTGGPLVPNTYAQVVLTRDSAKNVVGYVNGISQFSFLDTFDLAVIDENNVLRFFQDDSDVSGEHSAGAVARIRLYDGALTRDLIAALDRLPSGMTLRRGDLTRDMRLNILDIIALVRLILGLDPTPPVESLSFALADVNEDGVLNILDVVHLVNLILELPMKVVAGPAFSVTVNLGDVQTLSAGQLAIPVTMQADGTIAGAQMAFAFDPAQLQVGTPQLTGRADGMTLVSHVTEGTLRIIVYSATGQGITAGSGTTLLIPVTILGDASAQPSLTLSQVILATRQAQVIPVTLGTSTVKVAPLPTTFALKPNQPNPFNPTTRLAYDVPQAAHIVLAVYNLLGQEVIRLVDADQQPGRYEVVWAGRTGQGLSVASGVYLYRLTTSAGFSQTKRMTLLK